MNTGLINKIESKHARTDLPNFKVGDTIEVNTIIREGEKKRNQKFKGLVLEIRGSGTRRTFTVRKISYGIGVEKIFPISSPNIASITVLKHGKVTQSNIFYMRERIGKLAMKVAPGKPAPVIEHPVEEVIPEVVETEEEPNTETVEETVEEVEAPTPEADTETKTEESAPEPEVTSEEKPE